MSHSYNYFNLKIKDNLSSYTFSGDLNSLRQSNEYPQTNWSAGPTLRLHAQLYSTANIKAPRGSLGALSVNKLSHIPKLQPISAVYENQ